jgi:hypothetical protein
MFGMPASPPDLVVEVPQTLNFASADLGSKGLSGGAGSCNIVGGSGMMLVGVKATCSAM